MSTDGESRPGPAYVAFPSLQTFFGQLKEHGIPPQIDRSIMQTFSGGTQSHLVSALRFLRLADSNNAPTPAIRELVDAVGTDKWAAALRPVIEEAYKDILGECPIASATPQQVTDKLRAAGLEGSTLDKALRFFVQSMKEAKIEHSPYLGRRRKSSTQRRERIARRIAESSNPVVSLGDTGGGDDSTDSKDMISFPLHLPGKPVGKIVVPKSITPTDCKLIEAQMVVIAIYASQNKGLTGDPVLDSI
jgi:hypothetical protein